MYYPRKIMQSQYNIINGKGVNGNGSDISTVASLGRTRHVQQVASDRYRRRLFANLIMR